ncbi:hypothetical protein AGR4C_Lc80142 [Agrobacterium tumefaciens str. Kerr 14]|uniref:Uncharacterized protein n=1 Tax=Agrobacterium tumefaciens str. Kerr 14 TaxID=1183424 RepID=A0A1S7S4L5_AGRTU|nr:hypothetical protein AGR4C_Lc80142 [Agrobacterium tumefaciens str. Kerr 14]
MNAAVREDTNIVKAIEANGGYRL